jgi:hypothetical protein
MLAALADRTLEAPLRRSVEAHVADCFRCQALTAAMARAADGQASSAEHPAETVAWWRRQHRLRWLAPIAAAATAVALLVAVPGWRAQLTGPSPAPSMRPEEPPGAAPAAAPPPATPPQMAGPPPQELDARDFARTPPPVPPDAPARQESAGQQRAANAEPENQGAISGFSRVAPEQGVSGEERPEVSASRTLGKATGEAGGARRDEATASAAAEPLREREARAAAPAPADLAAPLAALGAFEVVSPDAQARWRVGPGGAVQASSDGGATWQLQQTGIDTPLAAGSSPRADVCWLVGRVGIVLRTTDGGQQWQRVPFPVQADLVAVASSSDLAATVDLADGRRFRTIDGGRTWVAAPAP